MVKALPKKGKEKGRVRSKEKWGRQLMERGSRLGDGDTISKKRKEKEARWR
ncbi:hypothetical protein Syun_011971 [Stephania yunnanensis]|uniref:Uncharacterized protein n=1 Tax=Stephania yunnanensis TaxID=152371 RepID=A0AAP0PJ06_9MAGN